MLFNMMLMILMIVGCSSKTVIADEGNYYINKSFSSITQYERIEFLIFHFTTVNDTYSLQLLTRGNVSAHYLIMTNPKTKNDTFTVFNLVPEYKKARHAGISNWNGKTNLNDVSIGIEIVNEGFTVDKFGNKIWHNFREEQISVLISLSNDIIKRYQISPDNILGHSDIAPLRKYDPGKLFPWERLAKLGIGAWPNQTIVKKYLAGRSPSSPGNVTVVQRYLQIYGYDKIPQTGWLDEETRRTIGAFQLHFRQEDIRGEADAETEAIAGALVEKYRKITYLMD
ncbi:N-acetylmuramoyl-L-alanine amidase AmiD-like [Planococcus citri]|uniref:N-acetylmuramoyl-L-alanine amidase n=1 Tax=Planococcus citri TaxID=170843 RepID=S5NFZ2_9HEMI|nr:n-acetylmuramoyl-l-alanine amidase [Planococcus citri]